MIYNINLRSLIGGLLSYTPGLYQWWDNRRPTGNAASAEYAEGIWQFHLKNLQQVKTENYMPDSIAELGPGASLGSCISALKSGVRIAIGLDVCPYAENINLNIDVLNKIIPPAANQELHDELTKNITTLNDNNVNSKNRLRYVAPWYEAKVIEPDTIDFIFSHSVLEHVNNPMEVYRCLYFWLKPGGMMSHKIDHSSHEITTTWNGHYCIPRWIWAVLQGRKPYLLNRLSPSQHREFLLASGFEILSDDYVKSSDGDNNCLSVLSDDEQIKTSTFILRKPSS